MNVFLSEDTVVQPDLLAVCAPKKTRSVGAGGGIQMLYIGDRFQLPPVVKDDEWVPLRPPCASAFFFDAASCPLEGETLPSHLFLRAARR